MKYVILCLLRGNVEKYHRDLVNEVAEKFGLTKTWEQNLATHFTLKYWFETDNVKEIEEMIEKFCSTHKKTRVEVGGFGNFPPKVIFINVKLSEEAKKTFLEFISELKKVDWMPWDKYDGENLHFYATIAEECNEKFDDIWEFVQGREKDFDCWFDNITILKLASKTPSIGEWKIHKTSLMM